MLTHPVHETEAEQQQYIERTRITLKKDPTNKNTKSKNLKNAVPT